MKKKAVKAKRIKIKQLNKVDYFITDLVDKRLQWRAYQRDRNMDSLFIVFGKEGSGKSTLVQQLANRMIPLNLNNMVYDPDTFVNKTFELSKDNLILDEAVTINTMEVMSRSSRNVFKRLAECRSRLLYIWLCIPNLANLPEYVINRACAVIYCDLKGQERQRGVYYYYDEDTKEMLYHKLKKNKLLDVAKINFPTRITGYFTKHWVIPFEEYEKHKQEALARSVRGTFKGNLCSCGSSSTYSIKNVGFRCRICGKTTELAEFKETEAKLASVSQNKPKKARKPRKTGELAAPLVLSGEEKEDNNEYKPGNLPKSI